ncbi:MAG: GNAT family protein [Elusimicrobiota bacterium]
MNEDAAQASLAGRRVRLRAFLQEDEEALGEAVEASREALRRRFSWASRDDGPAGFLARSAREIEAGESLVFGVFEPRSGRLAGVAALRGRESARLSAWVRPDRQNRGFGTEAGKLIIDHVFKNRELHRICARIDPSNRPARRVLKKLGFRYEGCLRSERRLNGRWIDQECWGLLRSEWKK